MQGQEMRRVEALASLNQMKEDACREVYDQMMFEQHVPASNKENVGPNTVLSDLPLASLSNYNQQQQQLARPGGQSDQVQNYDQYEKQKQQQQWEYERQRFDEEKRQFQIEKDEMMKQAQERDERMKSIITQYQQVSNEIKVIRSSATMGNATESGVVRSEGGVGAGSQENLLLGVKYVES